MMNPPQDELHAWLALAGGGLAARQRSRRLLAHFGGPLEVFRATSPELQQALGGERCNGLHADLAQARDIAERTRRWLAASARHHVLTLGDRDYPKALLQSPDPPLLLHATGHLAGLSRPAVAVVGSRHATPAGLQMARRLAAELNVLGIEVVSGLAVGIDAAAHEAAMKSGSAASTIAVVACGLDEVYPRQHRTLFEQMAEAGLVVSEHPLGTPALPPYFPQRNRIIAGLSCAVVVVEATVRSGSLITARLASEAGRDVFAVPGHLSSPQSAGCNQLIKAGAGLLEQVRDIVESQPWAFGAEVHRAVQPARRRRSRAATPGASLTQPLGEAGEPAVPGGPDDQSRTPQAEFPLVEGGLNAASWSRARRLLRARPCDLAELAEAASDTATAMSRTLLMAELEGWVARLPGGLYQWCARP